MIKKLLSCVRQYKKASILTPMFMIGEVLMETLIPYVMASLIDQGINRSSMPDVYRYGLLMLLFAAFSLVFGVLGGKFGAEASSGFAANLREDMYKNIQTFSFSNIDKFSTAGLVTRMTTDVTNVQNAYQMVLRIAVRAPLTFLCSIVMCFRTNRPLSFIFLAAVVFLSLCLSIIVRMAMKRFDQVFQRYDDLNASVQENVSAIRVVKAFVREDYETEKFRNAVSNLYRMFVRAEKVVCMNGPLMMFTVYSCILMLSWLGAKFIIMPQSGAYALTTGELTSMFSYVMSVLMSLMMLSMIFVMLTMSMASGRRISEVLDERADITNPETPVLKVPNGRIDFEHVSFSYKTGTGENTLSDIDLHIESGETIGIIGGTGSGKSSFVNLISRLYDVSKGSIRVGGIDVRSYDLEVLRTEVAVVLQKNVLFSGTILENLRWGNENASEEECREACRQACADEFIERMPDGYQTQITQGGTNVSGGQKQRLCIARALLKKPKILILDDSTSAVDTSTDARIRKALKEAIPGTTKLIIAQRIASVMEADKILVLDEGKISAFGTHDELLNSSAIYREIYQTQTQGGGDFDQPGPGGD